MLLSHRGNPPSNRLGSPPSPTNVMSRPEPSGFGLLAFGVGCGVAGGLVVSGGVEWEDA